MAIGIQLADAVGQITMSTVFKREATVQEYPKSIELPRQSRSELFFNRELSLLEFHGRVLGEVEDARDGLMELLEIVRGLTTSDASVELGALLLEQQPVGGLGDQAVDVGAIRQTS